MEFTLEMNYTQKSMTAMARALRVGLQEEQDKKSKIIGWGFIALSVFILVFSGKFGWMQILGAVIVALFAAYLIWQDNVNAYLALKRLPEKMRTGQWLFREDGYYMNTEAGESDFLYKNIFAMVESDGFIFLVFHEGRAQILDLSTVQGGTADDFRRHLRKMTSLTLQKV